MSFTKLSLRKLPAVPRWLVLPALIFILAAGAIAGFGIFFQGFEIDTSTWFYNNPSNQDIFQEPSGYTDASPVAYNDTDPASGGYGSGIASSAGSYHARLLSDLPSCSNDHSPPTPDDCAGPYTQWNEQFLGDVVTNSGSNVITSASANFTSVDIGFAVSEYANPAIQGVIPASDTIVSVTDAHTAVLSLAATGNATGVGLNVYPAFTTGDDTQVDIYLDTSWAALNPDRRFDWDSALDDDTDNNFLSDYAFNVGTQLSGDATGGFWVSTSTNATRSSTYPENPCPSPGVDAIGNHCRVPVKITTSGWYTFHHFFRIDPVTQNLSVEFTVVDANGNKLVDQTIYGWQGNAAAPAGGIAPAYGWYANQEIPYLAVDNSVLRVFPLPQRIRLNGFNGR